MAEMHHDNTKSTHCRDVGALSPSQLTGKECNVVTKRIPIVLGYFVNRTVLQLARDINYLIFIFAKSSPQTE